mmetsp:Transcript_83232/g.235755  ORF Transcript_83232/g.235755 Transcript_83232/m.235755 type:complete len:214 (-) Transcript_83232:784-1425(-)
MVRYTRLREQRGYDGWRAPRRSGADAGDGLPGRHHHAPLHALEHAGRAAAHQQRKARARARLPREHGPGLRGGGRATESPALRGRNSPAALALPGAAGRAYRRDPVVAQVRPRGGAAWGRRRGASRCRPWTSGCCSPWPGGARATTHGPGRWFWRVPSGPQRGRAAGDDGARARQAALGRGERAAPRRQPGGQACVLPGCRHRPRSRGQKSWS